MKVRHVNTPPTIDANWEKQPWLDIKTHTLKNHMGKKPRHFPKTEVKLAYDNEAIYVIFHVKDRYVRAMTEHHQGPVCQDSCVEFFFIPGDKTSGYFNLEMNCGGKAFLSYQLKRNVGTRKIPAQLLEKIEVAHSMPGIVDPEMKDPVTWTIEYRLPLTLLQDFAEITKPAPGIAWRANFYKCADKSSHPHWLTWAPVNLPEPDFHQPDYFGTLVFE